jgi:hypothetical protein
LRTDNGWLEYRLQIVQYELLNQGTQAPSDGSAVKGVTPVLLERDEELRKAREDLVAMQTVAVEWEMELASTRSELQLDRTILEGAQS